VKCTEKNSIEVHRNGLVHFVKEYGNSVESANTKLIDAKKLYVDLLQTIQFAEMIYSLYDFMGKVIIILRVMNTLNSKTSISPLGFDVDDSKCDVEEIYIEREWDSWRLTDDYSEIGKSIMDEFSNYYGSWEAKYD
jgi:hypothetical protein